MRVLIADPDNARREYVANKLRTMAGVSLNAVCANLSKAFDTIEHRPPHLVLYAAELTHLPEFDAMETLCRYLSVRWMTYGLNSRTAGTAAANLEFAWESSAIVSALNECMRGKTTSATGAAAGLFHAPALAKSDRIVVIGSSTGGVDALLHVLGSFPADCPPTLVVQHTGASFSAGLARLIDGRVEPRVVEACDGDKLMNGRVMIAPGADAHMVLNSHGGLTCRLATGEKVSGHRPSVDAMFKSAVPLAKRVTAVILTGMGRDGADGMLALKAAGAQTIGQDKATSLVYGMPGAAAELGAVSQVLPLSAIGPAIMKSAQVSAI